MMFCNNDAWKPLLLAVVSVVFLKSWKVLVSIVLKRNPLHCKEKNFSSPVNCSSGYEIVFLFCYYDSIFSSRNFW